MLWVFVLNHSVAGSEGILTGAIDSCNLSTTAGTILLPSKEQVPSLFFVPSLSQIASPTNSYIKFFAFGLSLIEGLQCGCQILVPNTTPILMNLKK